MEIFKAGVQYGDLKGSSAADHADMKDAAKWLKERNHINDDELVLGISMSVGENHGTHIDPVSVVFLVSGLNSYKNIREMIMASNEPIQVKKISIDMNIVDFLALFKRLEITLSNDNLLEGKSYSYN